MKICIFHLLYLLKAGMNLNGTEWLVEKDWKTFKKDKKNFGNVLKIWQRNTCGIAAFLKNVTRCNNFSNVSLYFEKIVDTLRKVLQTYCEISIFCVIQYIGFQKQSTGGTLEVLRKPLKIALNEVHFIVNPYIFSLSLCLQDKPFLNPDKSLALS